MRQHDCVISCFVCVIQEYRELWILCVCYILLSLHFCYHRYHHHESVSLFSCFHGERLQSNFLPWGTDYSNFLLWRIDYSNFLPWRTDYSNFLPWRTDHSNLFPWGTDYNNLLPWGTDYSDLLSWGTDYSNLHQSVE